MNWHNELTRLLKITYPLIQAPMLGITTPGMVAAAANCGTLGSLPVGGLSPERTAALIRETKMLTDRPFAVNLFVYEIPPGTDGTAAAEMQQQLQSMAHDAGLEYDNKALSSFRHYSYQEQVQVLLEENIRIVSFTFGIPDETTTRTLNEKGILLIGTATSVKEALLLQEKGSDIITAQGIEAGGHRGSFLDKEYLPEIGSISLIPQIADRVTCPVIAAGGIKDGRTVKAAMALGAQGVQIGSALLASEESLAIPAYKAALQQMQDTDPVLTRSFSGRWARGIRNAFMEAIDRTGRAIPEYPWQNSLTSAFRAAAQKADQKEYTNLWAGQSAAGAPYLSTATILQQIIRETEALPLF